MTSLRFFVCFSAALAWAVVVCGAAGLLIATIDPDRLDASVGDIAASVGVLAVAAVLVIGGFVLAENTVNGKGRSRRERTG